VPLPSNLLQAIRVACSRHGAALIVDEGQCAFGRTGLLFECLRHGVQPDILTVSKGMGGTYYPISATIFNSRLNRFMLTHTLIHLSTFGGADLGCLVAIATIEIIRKNRLWENARVRGAEMTKGLQQLAAADPNRFSAVRGEGLMLGLELTDAAAAEQFAAGLAAKGVIALPTTLNPRVIRFTPPIDITAEQTTELLDCIFAAVQN
jgi:acetylornithine/succinyldiaminopimelate/putrescine aminotransferase